MKEDMINLGIVLLPPQDVSQAAIQLSKRVADDFQTFFVLEEQSNLPHISLSHAAFPERNMPQIKKELRTLSEAFTAFLVELANVSWNKDGWIDIQAVKSKEFLNLHEEVVRALNPLREGSIMASDEVAFSSYSVQEQQNLKLYGYRHAVNLFRPHLTITRLQGGDVASAAQKLAGTTFRFAAKTLAVCQLGEHGTCKKLLENFELK